MSTVKNKDIMSVGFRVRGDKYTPDEITELLGVSPTYAWEKGDIHQSKRRNDDDGSFYYVEAKRPWGIWALSSQENISSKNLEDHALFIINKLGPSEKQINRLIDDKELRVAIDIWWQPEGGYGGYTLSANIVKKLSSLCSEMDFSFS